MIEFRYNKCLLLAHFAVHRGYNGGISCLSLSPWNYFNGVEQQFRVFDLRTVWFCWFRLFFVRQKAENGSSTCLWNRINDLPVFRQQLNIAGYHRMYSFRGGKVNGSFSGVGKIFGKPYTSDEDAKKNLFTFVSFIQSKKFKIP